MIPWATAAAAICVGGYLRAADALEGIGYRSGEAYARLRAARQLVEAGRRAEADVELQRCARVLARRRGDALRARGRGASRRFRVNEARFVAAAVRLGQLGLVERADPLE